MKNKKTLYAAVAIVLVLVLAAGGWWFFSKSEKADPKANAMAVLEAMMNGPNRELFDPAAMAIIGNGVPEPTAEEKAKQQAAQEQMVKAWEETVGTYFAPNCFESFFNTGAVQYVSMAEMLEQPITMENAELVEEDKYLLRYNVTLSIGGAPQQVEVVFHVDENGLFTSVMATGK